jgi:transcription initiation factor TFIIF subunit alpha
MGLEHSYSLSCPIRYNFSKIAQYKQLTLEEAEEKMNRRGSSASGYERWMMKAAANGAAAFSSGVKRLDDVNIGATNGIHPKKGDRNENGNQSDKVDVEEGGAARKNRLGLTMKGMDEDDEEGGKDIDFDLDDEIEKGVHIKYYLLFILRFYDFLLALILLYSTYFIIIPQNYSQFHT